MEAVHLFEDKPFVQAEACKLGQDDQMQGVYEDKMGNSSPWMLEGGATEAARMRISLAKVLRREDHKMGQEWNKERIWRVGTLSRLLLQKVECRMMMGVW